MGFKTLTTFTNNSIANVRLGSKYTSEMYMFSLFFPCFCACAYTRPHYILQVLNSVLFFIWSPKFCHFLRKVTKFTKSLKTAEIEKLNELLDKKSLMQHQEHGNKCAILFFNVVKFKFLSSQLLRQHVTVAFTLIEAATLKNKNIIGDKNTPLHLRYS